MENEGSSRGSGQDSGQGSGQGSSQSESQSKKSHGSRRLSIQLLVHSFQCHVSDCSLPSCRKMKRVVQHAMGCKRKTKGGCLICKKFFALCTCHAKRCQEHKCPVPFCHSLKHKLRRQQAQLLRQRVATVHIHGMPQQSLPPASALPSTSQMPQPPIHRQPSTVSVSPAGFPSVTQAQPPVAGTGKPSTQAQAPQPPPAAVGAAEPRERRSHPQKHLYRITIVSIKNSTPPGRPGTGAPGNQTAPTVGSDVPRPSQVSGPSTSSVPPGQGQQGPMPPQQQIPGMPRPVIAIPAQPAVASVQPPRSISSRALHDLLQALRSPVSPQQQQQVLNILKANPNLMVAFVKQRVAKYAANQPGPQPQPGMPGQPGLQNPNAGQGDVPPPQQAMGGPNPEHDRSMVSMDQQQPGSAGPVGGVAGLGPFQQLHGLNLCISCYNAESQLHKLDDEGSSQGEPQPRGPRESRRLSIQRCIRSLMHACQCCSVNCSLPSCRKMKRVVQHTKGCKRKTNGGCPVCKQLIALCCYHAKHCQENRCPVPFCLNIKQKLRRRQIQHRRLQAQVTRRRMAG